MRSDGEMDVSCEAIEIRGLRESGLDSSRGLGMTLKRGLQAGRDIPKHEWRALAGGIFG